MNNILEVRNINAYYEKSHILFDTSLTVEEGESVCILGRNGVGKSTTMKTIMGLMNSKNRCSSNGEILFCGENILGLEPNQIALKGISYVPQGRHIFPTLTTKENLLIAQKKGSDGKSDWNLSKIYEMFPRLKERESSMGGKLSGGEQQMLAIARGLMQNPKFLILDEICEGLAPIIVQELVGIIDELRKRKVTILLAEQSINFALAVSSRCYILEKGKVVYVSENNQIPDDVLAQYLGM